MVIASSMMIKSNFVSFDHSCANSAMVHTTVRAASFTRILAHCSITSPYSFHSVVVRFMDLGFEDNVAEFFPFSLLVQLLERTSNLRNIPDPFR